MNTGRYDGVDFHDHDTNFPRSWLPSSELSDSQQSRRFLETPVTPSRQEAPQQTSMSGRRTQESPTLSLSLAPWLSNATARWTGTLHGNQQNVESSMKSQPMSDSIPTTPCVESPKITWSPSRWKEWSTFSGARQELESPVVRGVKPDSRLIRRFRQRNSGMDTMDTNTWLSTNSPAKLESSTYSDGATDTPCPSKQKAQPVFLTLDEFGLPPMWIPESGTQTHQSLKRKRC